MSTTTLGALNYSHQQEQRALDTIGVVVSKAIAGRNGLSAETVFSRLRPNTDVRVFHKAAVPALGDTTVDPTFAPRGVGVLGLFRQRTILGRLVGVRRVPAYTRLYALTGGATGTWMIEGFPIPVSAPVFSTQVNIVPGRIATIIPVTRELAESPDPAAMATITRDVTRALAVVEDEGLLDAAAAVPAGRPAGLLHNVAPIGGGSPATTEADVVAVLTALRGGAAESMVILVSQHGVLYLATLRDNGVRLFPNIGVNGGDLFGVPVLVTEAAESKLIALDPAALFVADLGVELLESREATIELVDNPAGNAKTGTGAQSVSLFQANALAIRGQRYLGWHLADATAVQWCALPVGSPA